MKNDSAALSIDLIAGFTIFLVAFIWVITLIPGVLVNLQAYTIDYDAVAYRTGVILVEDPGEPWATKAVIPSYPWENPRTSKNSIARFGLAISKDAPNILSEDKIARFFNTSEFTSDWEYQYRRRITFGDYPYYFNISLRNISVLDGDNNNEQDFVGRALPSGSYGYSRRLVKIKSVSSATLDNTSLLSIQNRSYVNNYTLIEPYDVNATMKGLNATRHVFSISIDPPLLDSKQDPAYKINLANEPLRVNISGLSDPAIKSNQTQECKINLTKIEPTTEFGGIDLSVDGNDVQGLDKVDTEVKDYLSITIHPEYFQHMNFNADTPADYKPVLFNLTFEVRNKEGGKSNSTFLNNTWISTGPNSTAPFPYDYNPENVIQPQLRDAVVEVAISSGGQKPFSFLGGTTQSYTIRSSAGDHGGISPIGSTTVYEGDSQTFTISPVTGYRIDDVLVDGGAVGPVSSWTFADVDSDHTIHATFKTGAYTITATSGPHGTVEPAGDTYLDYGGSQAYAITPEAGYAVADVLVDGESVGRVSGYTFAAVQADHTISATFRPGYTITATSGPHGTVEPPGIKTVYEGDSQTYNITPDLGYEIDVVNVDGSSVGAKTSVTFNNVQEDHTVDATFKLATFTVTATAGPNGTIAPVGSKLLTYFENQTYTITADTGFYINYTYVDGDRVVMDNRTVFYYDFKNITSDHTIDATFMSPQEIQSVVIDGIPAPGGTLTANVTPPDAEAYYQWQNSTSATGPFADIPGATSKTFMPGSGDLGTYIRVVATGYDAYYGSVTSSPVIVLKALTGVSIRGETLPPSTLTANVTPPEATALYQWQRSASPFGPYKNISGATAIDYSLTTDDIGYYLKVLATGTDAYTGTVTSPWIAITTQLLGVSIAGVPEPGDTLSAVVNPAGATASCQWEVSRDGGLSYIPIFGASLCNWQIPAPGKEYVGNYIVVIATGWGNYTGNVTSPAVKVGTYLESISISGTPKIGTTLTTALLPAGATATYQWQKSLLLAGPYTDITGATAGTYTPVSGDLNYYLKVLATGTGDYRNTVNATTTTVVGKGSLTGVSITGTPQVDGLLTANVLPATATATYQWQRSTKSSGPYTNITDATSQTYTPVSSDFGYYIRIIATGSGDYTGAVTSAPVGPVTTALTGVSITGTPQFSSPLTAVVAPSGATASFQWQRSSSAGGPYTNIAGATSQTYTQACADVGNYIQVMATGTGSYSGTVTSTPVGPVTAIPLDTVYITGTVKVQKTLTANVLPSGATGGATYQWKRSLAFAGPYTDIAGAISQTYKLANGDANYYIEITVTAPCGYSGTLTSPPVGPVQS